MSVPNCHENRFPVSNGYTNQEQNTPNSVVESAKKAAKACNDKYGSKFPISPSCVRNCWLAQRARDFESMTHSPYNLGLETREIFEYCYPEAVKAEKKAKLEAKIAEETAKLKEERSKLATQERYLKDLKESLQSDFS